MPHVEVPVRGGMTQLLAMPRSGDRLIFASFQAGQVGMLDVSRSGAPGSELASVNLGVDAGPHMIALTDDDKRLVVSDYFLNEDDFGKVHLEGDHHVRVIRVSRNGSPRPAVRRGFQHRVPDGTCATTWSRHEVRGTRRFSFDGLQ